MVDKSTMKDGHFTMKDLKSENINDVNHRPPWRGLLIFCLVLFFVVSLGKEFLYRPEPPAPPPTAWPTQTALPTYTPHPTYTPVILTATPNYLATQQALELATVAADSGQQMALQVTRLAIIQATVEPLAKELDQTAAAVLVLDHEVNAIKGNASAFLTVMQLTACVALNVAIGFMVYSFLSDPTKVRLNVIDELPRTERTVLEPFLEPEVEPLRTVFRTVPVRSLEPVLEPQELEKLDPSRPPTAREVRLIQSTYNRFKSKTAVCNALYGFKNQAVWDYVSSAIDASGGGE